MKIYKQQNVFDAALDRIRFLFDEFDNVIIGVSGGKDSTVIFNLALMVAKEKNRLPLKVLFVDQEAEWGATIDHVKEIMETEGVEPIWLQMPFKITNSTSVQSQYLIAWEHGVEHIHPYQDISIKENVYGTDKFDHTREFYEIFSAYTKYHYPKERVAYLAGVRCEESPSRFVGLTHHACYKHITWGKVLNKKIQHYTFYPLYDWSYLDIWKAIQNNHWTYCKLYDYMYMYGVAVQEMRVSNLHHETAVRSLFYFQEIETDTYNRAVKRLNGIDTAGKFTKDEYFVKELPQMFVSWKEYRDFLVEKLIEPDKKELFFAKFRKMDEQYGDIPDVNVMYKQQVMCVIINDFGFVKINNWEKNPQLNEYRHFKKTGKRTHPHLKNAFLTKEQLLAI